MCDENGEVHHRKNDMELKNKFRTLQDRNGQMDLSELQAIDSIHYKDKNTLVTGRSD